MAFSDYTENALLGHLLGSTTFTKPASKFLGLFTAAPSDAGGGTEVSGGSYARLSTGNLTVSGTSPTVATNGSVLEFAAATAGWGTITHVGIFDASTAGNLLAWAPLTASKTIATGDVFRIPAGDLDITLD